MIASFRSQFGFVPSSHCFDLTVQGWFVTAQPARSGSVLQSWVDLLLHWDLNRLECYLLVTSLLSGDVWCGVRIVTAILTENMSSCVFDSAKQIILSHLNPSACNGMIVRWAEYIPVHSIPGRGHPAFFYMLCNIPGEIWYSCVGFTSYPKHT